MLFIILTFLTAFSIEGLGTYVSVIGLSTLFGANPIIIALAVALDAGKLIVVTLLYSRWKTLSKIMKTYALFAAAVTMIITSAGAAGYLSGEFQKAILGTQEGSLKVDVLKGQIAKYEERKKQIDAQIAALPEKTSVSQRLRLMNGFKAEQQDLQAKISDIDKQLPDLQIKQIGVEAKAGPILYIAKAFDIPVESAVKYVILMIIFVFDPLAVFLIIAGNFLLHQWRVHKGTTVEDADLFEESLDKFEPVKHGGEFPAVVEDPTPPIFEVLQASPVKPVVIPAGPDASQAKVYSEDDIAWLTREGPMAKTHDDTHQDKHYVEHPDYGPQPKTFDDAPINRHYIEHPEPEADPETALLEHLEVPSPREVITREQLLPTPSAMHFPHVSSLNAIPAGQVSFDANPQSEARGTYSNLK